MNIEAGKFYQTRDGQKVRIYATDGNDLPIHGAYLCENGWEVAGWHSDGTWIKGCRYSYSLDIIAPWIEKPIVDWSAMPKWVVGVFCNPQYNRWFSYTKDNKPVKRDLHWETPNTLYLAEIPPAYYPTDSEGKPWSGAWEDSLVERPEGE